MKSGQEATSLNLRYNYHPKKVEQNKYSNKSEVTLYNPLFGCIVQLSIRVKTGAYK